MYKVYSLNDVLEEIVDNRGKTCPVVEDGIPLIATNCIRNENLYPTFEKIRFVSDETYRNWFRGHPKKDDIIFVCKGSPGRTAWFDASKKYCIAQDMVALRANSNIVNAKYLFALLRSSKVQHQIQNMHVGTLIPHFKKGDFKNLHLEIIKDISIQEKIGNIYFDYSKKIQLNNEINATLEQIAQAIFKSWFIDFDPVHAKAHAHQQALTEGKPDSQAQHLANVQAMQVISGKKAEELAHMEQTQPSDYAQLLATAEAFPSTFDDKGLPLGWEEMTADNLIEFNPKEKLPKGTLSTYFDMASIPTKGCTAEPPIKRDFSSGTKFQNNDTLLARITPCLQNGKTAYIQGLIEGEVAWGSTEFIVMRAKNGIPKQYSYILARYEDFRAHAIQSMTGTSGRQRAQVDVVKHFKVVNPNCAEIWLAFSKVIQPMFNLIFTNSQQNIYLAKARDALLPKLLSGEV